MVDDFPLRFLGHRALLVALRLWLKTARLCNMHMERTLSQITRSVPKRSHIERLIGSGFLVQLQAFHASAGGNDIRHLTRAQLLKDGAPLRASKRRSYRRVRTQPTYIFIGLTRNGRTSKSRGSPAAPESSTVSACGLVGASTARPFVPRC